MRYYVNSGCVGCGLCAGTCPEVFSMQGDVSVAKKEDVTGEVQERAEEAKNDCPVAAIEHR